MPQDHEGEDVIVEALNPLYIPQEQELIDSSQSQTETDEQPQMTSSVKDRISEFESVQSSSNNSNNNNQSKPKSPGASSLNSAKNPLFLPTQSSSLTCEAYSPNTVELDQVIQTLMSPSGFPENEEQPNSLQLKIQPAQTSNSENLPVDKSPIESSLNSNLESPDHTVMIPNESITWPTGIVKRQKQDFEEKVKLKEKTTKSNSKESEGTGIFSRQESVSSISSQNNLEDSVKTPEVLRQDSSNLDSTTKRDDPFSMEVDKIFDKQDLKQDKKQNRLSSTTTGPITIESKESPSRNSSFGSFDSAVVFTDRDFLSRHSSWGSCDTRSTGGTIPSRNSSFGAFDMRQQQNSPLTYNQQLSDTQEQIQSRSYLTGTCFDKDSGTYSPVTVKRNKVNFTEPKDNNKEPEIVKDGSAEEEIKLRPVSIVRAYGPAPFKLPCDKSSPENLDTSNKSINKDADSSITYYTSTSILPITIQNNSINNNDRSQTNSISSFYSPERELEASISAVSPMEETTELQNSNIDTIFVAEVPAPGTVKQQKLKLENRSQNNSSGYKRLPEKLTLPNFSRSLSSNNLGRSESPRKLIGRSFSEKRSKFESDSPLGAVKKITKALETQNEGRRGLQWNFGGKMRSQSLERLSTSPTSSCSTSSSNATSPSSQHLLGQLLGETQAQVRELVGLFEDTQDKQQSSPNSKRLGKKRSRPRSDSVSENVLPPVVPQRKSSLDYNFRPAQRSSSQPPQTPVRQSSKSPTTKVPPCVPKPPSTNVRSQACGTEVRQKKQQGKTHPLSKLTPRENTTL